MKLNCLLMVTFLWFSCTQTKPVQDAVIESSTKENSTVNYARSNTELSEYVYSHDDAFDYTIVDEIAGEGHTLYVVKMISQEWLTKKEVIDPVWWHWLSIIIPNELVGKKAMLMIAGGSKKTNQPSAPDQMALHLAMSTSTIVASLHNIPNQAVEFVGDDFGPRVEDELIAYGWKKFLDGGARDEDMEWLARFPMTKAAVRALDVISELSKNQTNIEASQFVVTGASKRGWTCWTTAAVDRRVVAIAPAVIDMLNMIPSFEHHWRVYGEWAPAIGNYVEEGIMDMQNTTEYDRLNELTEPYSFRQVLDMPKLILSATGDEFFIPDSWQFYWDDLIGEKHLRYVPNSNHSMRDTDVLETLTSFYQMIVADHTRPKFDWSVDNGVINIQTHDEPDSVLLWQAHNSKERNFMIDKIGRAYQSTILAKSDSGHYSISIDTPENGYSAFFVELNYTGLNRFPLKLSTGVVVTPNVYPYERYRASKN